MNHFFFMALYAALVAAFFALLTRRKPKEQLRLFLTIFCTLVGGALALAWLMYFFPTGPPAPIP